MRNRPLITITEENLKESKNDFFQHDSDRFLTIGGHTHCLMPSGQHSIGKDIRRGKLKLHVAGTIISKETYKQFYDENKQDERQFLQDQFYEIFSKKWKKSEAEVGKTEDEIKQLNAEFKEKVDKIFSRVRDAHEQQCITNFHGAITNALGKTIGSNLNGTKLEGQFLVGKEKKKRNKREKKQDTQLITKLLSDEEKSSESKEIKELKQESPKKKRYSKTIIEESNGEVTITTKTTENNPTLTLQMGGNTLTLAKMPSTCQVELGNIEITKEQYREALNKLKQKIEEEHAEISREIKSTYDRQGKPSADMEELEAKKATAKRLINRRIKNLDQPGAVPTSLSYIRSIQTSNEAVADILHSRTLPDLTTYGNEKVSIVKEHYHYLTTAKENADNIRTAHTRPRPSIALTKKEANTRPPEGSWWKSVLWGFGAAVSVAAGIIAGAAVITFLSVVLTPPGAAAVAGGLILAGVSGALVCGANAVKEGKNARRFNRYLAEGGTRHRAASIDLPQTPDRRKPKSQEERYAPLLDHSGAQPKNKQQPPRADGSPKMFSTPQQITPPRTPPAADSAPDSSPKPGNRPS